MEKKTLTDPASFPRITIIQAMVATAFIVALLGGYCLVSLGQHKAPNFAFFSLNGDKITSASLRGKVVVVNFWATSCTTCIHEMPKMVETYNKFKRQGLEFVAVAMRYDPPDYVVDYTQTRHLPFTVTYDGHGAMARAFGNVEATPTTFIIDRHGAIIRQFQGEPKFPELQRFLAHALKT